MAGSSQDAAPATVCANPDVPDLQRRAPGELVAYEEITPAGDPHFPGHARAWRVLYVSTGRDNNNRTLVCGVVLAPADRSRISASAANDGMRGRVVAVAHGTLGMVQRCQPSTDPARFLWGQTPWGVNVISWETGGPDGARTGNSEGGILAGMIDAGWIIAATDYETDLGDGTGLHPYLIGKIEAANTIDSLRAAHQLLARVYDGYDRSAYDVVTWGHSQGGHAALWAGQLLDEYVAATGVAGAPGLALSGVALEAPGSNFIVQSGQVGTSVGCGLVDWNANLQVSLTGVPDPIPLAPFIFSYLFGTWAKQSETGRPDPASMPAFPDGGPLDLASVVTERAEETAGQMLQYCWADGEAVATLAAPYRSSPFLQPELAAGAVSDGLQHGAFDGICAADPPVAIASWCAWLRYNLPGPLGVHPFSTLPKRGDRLVPVLIAAGANDEVVHCVARAGERDAVPSARDCMAVALYDALAADYCPAGVAAGHLSLQVWQAEPEVTVADHSAIAGLVAAASTTEPRFAGSPLQRFMTAAFDGSLAPECTATVVNAGNTA